jgi:hypothetical protein
MRPTLRCLLVFLAGIPLSLGAVAIHPRLWTVWVAYLGAAVTLAGLDGLLGLPRRPRCSSARPAPRRSTWSPAGAAPPSS